MKAKELLGEMLYLHPGEMPRKMLDGSISVAAVKREFTAIGSINSITVFMGIKDTHVIGIDADNNATLDNRLLPVFKLSFKNNHLLKFKHTFEKIIQVNRVEIRESSGNEGIMTSVYKMLVDVGYTVVSDITHFDPAHALWKKIAQDNNYKVYVADIEHGVFKSTDGVDIVYNGSNIPDQDIWSSGSDFAGEYRVLLLTK